MYTGYLDLNPANIYNILLATHILHMPRALELCRGFLVQTQTADRHRATNVIKPIPSRKAVQPHQRICPPSRSDLKKSEVTPFRSVERRDEEVAGPSRAEEKKTERQKKRREKTVVDIACCDGPVRFHRVINKNYGLPAQDSDYHEEVNRTQAMNKAMTENINKMTDENRTADLFTCLYCNHTFKSQYCYQKHARRHLNPVNVDAKADPKREVKLLDMNVQYYPCKTCGCKFPSYYFVHKHRKMCHAEEVAEKATEGTSSDESSAIDVESVNQ